MKDEEDEGFFGEHDEDDEPREPDYFMCGCGYTCATRPAWGGQCPKCTAIMEEAYF